MQNCNKTSVENGSRNEDRHKFDREDEGRYGLEYARSANYVPEYDGNVRRDNKDHPTELIGTHSGPGRSMERGMERSIENHVFTGKRGRYHENDDYDGTIYL